MSAVFASADQIARAVVAAARLTGADPLAIFDNPSDLEIIHARGLALDALKCALPSAHRTAMARGLGFATPTAALSNVIKYKGCAWWREDWVDEIVGAVLAPEIEPELGGAAPSSGPSGHLLPPKGVRQDARLAAGYGEKETSRVLAPPTLKRGRRALSLGEPEPGRSALDLRRSGAVGAGEDDAPQDLRCGPRRSPAPITLPRLKFLEKGAET